MSDTPNEISEMVTKWLAELPPKTRKSAKSDLTTALNYLDGDVLERARTDPTQLFTDLDNGLRSRQLLGSTRNKIKSVFRRWLRYHGIETLNTRPYRCPVPSLT